MNELKSKIVNLISTVKNNPKIIVAIGLLGVCIIFLSSVFENKNNTIKKTDNEITVENYCFELENKLCEQIKEVVGGDVKVMITLETGVEYIYASEAKNNESEIEDDSYNNGQKLQKDKQIQNNYILYKDESGNEVPLVVTEIMPCVKGVVVGCDYGNDEIVSSVIKKLVTTALDVSDDKVCVVGLDICK